MDISAVELGSSGQSSVSLEMDIGAMEGLKKMPVDMFDGVYLGKAFKNALILCVDIRNFSEFFHSEAEASVFKLIKEFTSNLLSCINQVAYGCSYYKLMGDGALVIWDETNLASINEALEIFDTYTEFLNDELFKSYDTLGMGGALVMGKVFKYEISAEVSQLKYRDYVGYGINLACRLQGMAGINQLILNDRLAISGAIPFKIDQSEKIIKELHILKGLMEEDRQHVLIYDKN